MKKFFIIAVAALLASAACTKVETIDNTPARKISFQVGNYAAQTKAAVSFKDESESFKSRAFLHAEGVDLNADYSVKTDSYQEFFGNSGETIVWDGTNTLWKPQSHDYYWPKSSHSFVNFASWYGTVNGAARDPTITYAYDNTASAWKASLEWNFTAVLGQATSNLLYADMAWRYSEQNPTNGPHKDGVTEGVPTLFHHALAQINIKAYADDAASGENLTLSGSNPTDGVATWTIALKNAKITPIFAAGTLSLTNTDPGTASTTQAWTGDWAGTGTAGDVAISDYNVTTVTKSTATDMVAASCVLPQTLGARVVLSFDLDITATYTNNAATHHEIIPYSIKLNDMGTTAWAQNTKYTYYLRIVPNQNKVLFDPAIAEDWATGTTVDQNI
ncbi:MAG: hypothetical protein J6X25_00150 [Bacteroidales bacterium]|nr:hypothetical protein [Bacteroidales bacterium]